MKIREDIFISLEIFDINLYENCVEHEDISTWYVQYTHEISKNSKVLIHTDFVMEQDVDFLDTGWGFQWISVGFDGPVEVSLQNRFHPHITRDYSSHLFRRSDECVETSGSKQTKESCTLNRFSRQSKNCTIGDARSCSSRSSSKTAALSIPTW